MAENSKIYYGSGIGVAGNIDIGALGLPADSRVMVKDRTGLTELQNAKRVYDGMLVYVESDQTYHKCRVIWDANMAITSCTWTEVVIKSEQELVNLITSSTTAAMEFKGATDALPESSIKGDMYKVSGAFEVAADADAQGAGFTTKVGDSIVYDGEKWYHIPSGDDIEDTWRTITGVNNDADLTFAAGDLLDVDVTATGTVTYSHEAVAAPTNTNADGDEKVREYITAVETDGHGHITGFKTNIETVADTSYDFEGTTTDSNVSFNIQKKVNGENDGDAEVIKIDAYTQDEVDNAIKVVTDAIVEDRLVWDLAGTAVQNSDFETFQNTNTEAINAAKKAGEDAAAAVNTEFTNYKNAHAGDYTNEQIDNAITTATGNLGSMSTKDADDYYTVDDIDSKDFASKTEAQGYATTAQNNAEAKAAELDAALKTELTGVINGVDAKFASYVTTAKYAEDKSAEDAIDADHETRISAVEAKFGTGEGTVENQIAAAISGVQSQIDALDNTYATDAELKSVKEALEAEAAKHALKTDVENEFKNYTTTEAQNAIDKAQDDRIKVLEDNRVTEEELADAIKDFETKANVAKVAEDLTKYEASNNAALAEVKATAEAAVTDTKLTTALEPYAKSADVETKTDAAAKLEAAKKYTDDAISTANLGQYTTEQEVKDIVDGVIKTATDKETLDSLVELVEYIDTHSGDAINMATAIGVLEGKVDVIEKKPSYGISDKDIENWNNEIGAKALAGTKTTTAEVKAQIEAYNYATDANAQQYAATAKTGAETTAHNELEAYKLVVDAELAKKQNNIPENTYDAYGSAAKALEDANSYTDTAIQGLDVTDNEVARQFVTAVSETDGKVAVSRRALVKGDIPILDRHQVNQWDYTQTFEKSVLNPDGGDLNGYLKLTVRTNYWDHFSCEFLITDNTFSENHTCGNFSIHSTYAGIYEGAYTPILGNLTPSHYYNNAAANEITIWVPIWAQNVYEGDSITVSCKNPYAYGDVSVSYVSNYADGSLPTKARYQGTNGIKVSYDTEHVNIGLDSNTTFIFDCGNASN